jgi:hypothetical protein
MAKEKSDGSSADYYKLPAGAAQLQDLISHRDMNAQIGEIFRACYRYGMVEHSPKLRDAKKIQFYINAEIARLEKLEKPEDQLKILNKIVPGYRPNPQDDPIYGKDEPFNPHGGLLSPNIDDDGEIIGKADHAVLYDENDGEVIGTANVTYSFEPGEFK